MMRVLLYMGNTAILIGASALVSALVCLFAGFRWGRSNVRSQIEDALDMARVSADAREFALREQLDEKMLELGELRARADEASLLREQLEQLQSSSMHVSPGDGDSSEATDRVSPIEHPHRTEQDPISGASAIRSFLGSKAAKPQPPDENQDVLPEKSPPPPVTKFPVRFPHDFGSQSRTPEPPKTTAVRPPAAINPTAVQPIPVVNNDDWDEFAKSLAALKKLQK